MNVPEIVRAAGDAGFDLTDARNSDRLIFTRGPDTLIVDSDATWNCGTDVSGADRSGFTFGSFLEFLREFQRRIPVTFCLRRGSGGRLRFLEKTLVRVMVTAVLERLQGRLSSADGDLIAVQLRATVKRDGACETVADVFLATKEIPDGEYVLEYHHRHSYRDYVSIKNGVIARRRSTPL